MLRYEVKKVFSKTVNKIIFMILTAIILIISFLAVGRVEYGDDNGNFTNGISAVRNLRNSKKQWSGYVDEDLLSKVIEKNEAINKTDEYLSKDYKENDKAYAKKQGFSDIITILNMAFTPFSEYDAYRADSISAKEAGGLYEKRIQNLTNWLESEEIKDNFSEAEKAFLISQYQKLETPFYYEYADGWKSLLEYAPSTIMLTVLVCGFFVSGIFSNEFQLKSDSIFFSAKLGRNRAVTAKIGAGFLIITVIYWVSMLLYSVVVFMLLGTGGAGCAIQTGMGGWKSFYNITYLQDYILTMLGGYLGSLFVLTVSMLISAKLHSTVLAVTTPFILLLIPSFLSGVSDLSGILGVLPDQLLQISDVISAFNLYQIGGKVIGAIPVIMILYLILYCFLLPVLYRVYRKTEIK